MGTHVSHPGSFDIAAATASTATGSGSNVDDLIARGAANQFQARAFDRAGEGSQPLPSKAVEVLQEIGSMLGGRLGKLMQDGAKALGGENSNEMLRVANDLKEFLSGGMDTLGNVVKSLTDFTEKYDGSQSLVEGEGDGDSMGEVSVPGAGESHHQSAGNKGAESLSDDMDHEFKRLIYELLTGIHDLIKGDESGLNIFGGEEGLAGGQSGGLADMIEKGIQVFEESLGMHGDHDHETMAEYF